MVKTIAIFCTLTLILSGCGDTRLERTGSGAATGAAIGLGTGYLSDPVKHSEPGLFIGMALGALVGYLLEEPLFFNRHTN